MWTHENFVAARRRARISQLEGFIAETERALADFRRELAALRHDEHAVETVGEFVAPVPTLGECGVIEAAGEIAP